MHSKRLSYVQLFLHSFTVHIYLFPLPSSFCRRFLRNESEFFHRSNKNYMKDRRRRRNGVDALWYLQAFYTRKIKNKMFDNYNHVLYYNHKQSMCICAKDIRTELNCLSCKLSKKPQQQKFFNIKWHHLQNILFKKKSSIRETCHKDSC